MLVTVGVSGLLATIATYNYFNYLPKSQAAESLKVMEMQRIAVVSSIQTNKCTLSGATETIKGKYGVLSISGTYTPAQGETCPTGCKLSYTFNSSGVAKQIAGKKVEANILHNMSLSKLSSTTLPDQYLSKTFTSIAVKSGDSCTAIGGKTSTQTNGSGTSGTETGALTGGTLPGVEPSPSSPPSSGTGTGGTGSGGTGTGGTGSGGTGGTGSGSTGEIETGGITKFTVRFEWLNQGGDVSTTGYFNTAHPISQNIKYKGKLLPMQSAYWLNNLFGQSYFILSFTEIGTLDPLKNLNVKVSNLTNGKSTVVTMEGGSVFSIATGYSWNVAYPYWGTSPLPPIIKDVLITGHEVTVEVLF